MTVINEIGGYLGLELNNLGSYHHDDAIAVNTGRNALEYILLANRFSTVYLPYYTCDAVLEAIKKTNTHFSFYSLNEDLSPNFNFENMNGGEGFLYTNYFGLCDRHVENLIYNCPNLILDNAQAFFVKVNNNIPAIYSPRKFFGVSDGGFLYSGKKLDIKLKKDSSLNRLSHLVGRIEESAQNFYKKYQITEADLKEQPLKGMSKITAAILRSIDYSRVSEVRQRNYMLLYKELNTLNGLFVPELTREVPLCYPLFLKNGAQIKRRLIQKGIFVPTFWPNVFAWAGSDSFEYDLTENLVCLPIDQRYGESHMKIIISELKSILSE